MKHHYFSATEFFEQFQTKKREQDKRKPFVFLSWHSQLFASPLDVFARSNRNVKFMSTRQERQSQICAPEVRGRLSSGLRILWGAKTKQLPWQKKRHARLCYTFRRICSWSRDMEWRDYKVRWRLYKCHLLHICFISSFLGRCFIDEWGCRHLNIFIRIDYTLILIYGRHVILTV